MNWKICLVSLKDWRKDWMVDWKIGGREPWGDFILRLGLRESMGRGVGGKFWVREKQQKIWG